MKTPVMHGGGAFGAGLAFGRGGRKLGGDGIGAVGVGGIVVVLVEEKGLRAARMFHST